MCIKVYSGKIEAKYVFFIAKKVATYAIFLCVFPETSDRVKFNSFLARLPELHNEAGGQICPSHCKPPKTNAKHCFAYLKSVGKYRNFHKAVFSGNSTFQANKRPQKKIT